MVCLYKIHEHILKKKSMQDKFMPMISPDFVDSYFGKLCYVLHFYFYHFIRLPKLPTVTVLKLKHC